MFAQVYALVLQNLSLTLCFFPFSAVLRTETAPSETPLPEDTVATADEEPLSAQVPFRLLFSPRLNKPGWIAPCFTSPSTPTASSELRPLVSSCPQDPAAPWTVPDAGGVSRGSAAAAVAVTAEGTPLPADQQQVLARSICFVLFGQINSS